MKYEAAGPVNFKIVRFKLSKTSCSGRLLASLNDIIGAIHVFTGNRFKLNGGSCRWKLLRKTKLFSILSNVEVVKIYHVYDD